MRQGNANGQGKALTSYMVLVFALGTASGLLASSVLSDVATGGLSLDLVPIYSVGYALLMTAVIAGLSFLLARLVRRRTQSEMDEMEHRMHEAEHMATDMAEIAYRDTLTQVKSHAAYDEYVTGLDEQIATADDEHKPEFSVVMADLNNLKDINDTYGHEAGDEYLVRACEAISDTFKHSPVFRIGGDEFVIILMGHDHHHRRQLVGCLEDTVRKGASSEVDEPWRSCSVAVGIACYHRGYDRSYSDVFERADARMYRKKAEMKERAERGFR